MEHWSFLSLLDHPSGHAEYVQGYVCMGGGGRVLQFTIVHSLGATYWLWCNHSVLIVYSRLYYILCRGTRQCKFSVVFFFLPESASIIIQINRVYKIFSLVNPWCFLCYVDTTNITAMKHHHQNTHAKKIICSRVGMTVHLCSIGLT